MMGLPILALLFLQSLILTLLLYTKVHATTRLILFDRITIRVGNANPFWAPNHRVLQIKKTRSGRKWIDWVSMKIEVILWGMLTVHKCYHIELDYGSGARTHKDRQLSCHGRQHPN
jgi:hypothetical protein